MKISLGTDAGGAIEVVVVYHLLNHRARLPGSKGKQWSISVGFNAAWVAGHEGGNPNNARNSYVQLAEAISANVKAEIASYVGGIPTNPLRFIPQPTSLVWIDDYLIPMAGTSPLTYKTESEAELRKKPIGELGWIAAHNDNIANDWPSWNTSRLPIPTDAHGNVIPEYSPSGKFVSVTEVGTT